MNVLVIEPGNGSFWLEGATYVDRFGQPNPRGRFVRGKAWEHEGGWNIPEGGFDYPVTLTYPRKWILKIEEIN